MPTSLHQGIIALFRDDPALAFDLLAEVFGVSVPISGRIGERSAALDRFAPCFGDTGELRPDLALSLTHAEHPQGGVGLIIEVQGRAENLKRWRMAVYRALLAERLQLPVALLLVPLSISASRWARGLGQLEVPPHEGLLVLDWQNMPHVAEPGLARRRPSKAILAALLRAVVRDFGHLRTALELALELGDDRRWRYAASILSAAPPPLRERLRNELAMDHRYELTELEYNSIAYHDGREHGREAARREGLVELLLTILELRHIPIDAETRAKIEGCEQIAELERWVARAKQVDALAAVFEPE